jgi:hypothetical protein
VMVKKRTSHSQLPPMSQKHGYISFILVMFRGFLLLWISFSINILNLMIYLTVRPWSRGLARRLIGRSTCKTPFVPRVTRIAQDIHCHAATLQGTTSR